MNQNNKYSLLKDLHLKFFFKINIYLWSFLNLKAFKRLEVLNYF